MLSYRMMWYWFDCWDIFGIDLFYLLWNLILFVFFMNSLELTLNNIENLVLYLFGLLFRILIILKGLFGLFSNRMMRNRLMKLILMFIHRMMRVWLYRFGIHSGYFKYFLLDFFLFIFLMNTLKLSLHYINNFMLYFLLSLKRNRSFIMIIHFLWF